MPTKNEWKKIGKKNLSKGRYFENLVRKDLEKKGWICSKWQNNVEFETHFPNYNNQKEIVAIKLDKENKIKELRGTQRFGKLVPAKQGRFRKTSTGFPDFICIRRFIGEKIPDNEIINGLSEVMAVECKSGKYLTQEEKSKCHWLISNNIFSKIIIASRGKKRGEIIYTDFEEYDK